jgi:cytochrome c1
VALGTVICFFSPILIFFFLFFFLFFFIVLQVSAIGLSAVAFASDDALHPPSYPWPNNKPWQSFDHASLRRGFYVYQQVCAACHSLEFVAYRNLVGTIMTEEEAKV